MRKLRKSTPKEKIIELFLAGVSAQRIKKRLRISDQRTYSTIVAYRKANKCECDAHALHKRYKIRLATARKIVADFYAAHKAAEEGLARLLAKQSAEKAIACFAEIQNFYGENADSTVH
jgi:hypothetical protein